MRKILHFLDNFFFLSFFSIDNQEKGHYYEKSAIRRREDDTIHV